MLTGIPYNLEQRRVWVAGHGGMVGSAIVRRLQQESCHILTADRHSLDLTRQSDVMSWITHNKPDAVVIAAAKVGGILANSSKPAEFIYDNLVIQTNIIEASHQNGVERLLFLGSSCIYPKWADQPITEDALLTGRLEPTNQWYAIAKIAGLKLVEAYREQFGRDYISAMPTNLYGPGDNFNLASSHVLPALMRKAHEAKTHGARELVIWGTGSPRREFLHVDDCADALVFLLQKYSAAEHINVGSGEDITIGDVAQLVADVVGFDGQIVRDTSKPDGTPRKLMSADKLRAMGWSPKIELREGLSRTYEWFLENRASSA